MIKLLGMDANKLWNQTDRLVKDFNACFDFFDSVLDGCMLAAISQYCFHDVTTTNHLRAVIGTVLPAERLMAAVTTVSDMLSDFHRVSLMRERGDQDRDVGGENLLLFMQEGLMLRHLSLAIRQGDSGRVVNALSYFTIWFQGTPSHKYAAETLRLTACLRKIWGEELRDFWMENGCMVNLSGKREGFIALDALNEYIVREVKRLVSAGVTFKTDEHLRNVLSLLVMDFWDIRRKMSEEAEMYIFDYHSYLWRFPPRGLGAWTPSINLAADHWRLPAP